MDIAARLMERIGLSKDGLMRDGIRWVAVHHGDQQVHIVGTLARQDGGRANLNNLYWKIGAALTEIEKEYGLRQLVRDKTADKALGLRNVFGTGDRTRPMRAACSHIRRNAPLTA